MATLPALSIGPTEENLAYGSGGTEEYRVRRVDFGDGYSQRGRKGKNSRRQQWRLQWTKISEADAEVLRDFFGDAGGVDVIEWTPVAQATELKWTATGWTNDPSGPGLMDCSIVLTQEFDL